MILSIFLSKNFLRNLVFGLSRFFRVHCAHSFFSNRFILCFSQQPTLRKGKFTNLFRKKQMFTFSILSILEIKSKTSFVRNMIYLQTVLKMAKLYILRKRGFSEQHTFKSLFTGYLCAISANSSAATLGWVPVFSRLARELSYKLPCFVLY